MAAQSQLYSNVEFLIDYSRGVLLLVSHKMDPFYSEGLFVPHPAKMLLNSHIGWSILNRQKNLKLVCNNPSKICVPLSCAECPKKSLHLLYKNVHNSCEINIFVWFSAVVFYIVFQGSYDAHWNPGVRFVGHLVAQQYRMFKNKNVLQIAVSFWKLIFVIISITQICFLQPQCLTYFYSSFIMYKSIISMDPMHGIILWKNIMQIASWIF